MSTGLFEAVRAAREARHQGGRRGVLVVRIHAPLLRLSKAGIIRLGRKLGEDYALTHSCYDPCLGGVLAVDATPAD
jgi:7-cyano-7-deazaguanine synthase